MEKIMEYIHEKIRVQCDVLDSIQRVKNVGMGNGMNERIVVIVQ
jgi:hypothetical protein